MSEHEAVSMSGVSAEAEKQPTKHIRILSVDGGGIRGILPLYVLKYIHDKAKKLKGDNFDARDLFDYFAGTSTGGIIALGLNSRKGGNPKAPYLNPEDLLELYLKQGQRIFPGGPKGPGMISPQYGSPPLEALLKETLGERVRLSDLTSNELDKYVAVYSYDILRDEPYIFSTHKAKPFSFYAEDPLSNKEPIEYPLFNSDQNKAWLNENNYYVWEAARSTSAAPTYFPAYQTSETISGTTKAPLARKAGSSCFSLTIHKGDLYLAWIDSHRGSAPGTKNSNQKLHKAFCSSYSKDGSKDGALKEEEFSYPVGFLPNDHPNDHWAMVDGGVATISFKGMLYAFWTIEKYEEFFAGKENRKANSLYYSTSKDGINWSGAKKFKYDLAYFGTPALANFDDDRLYVAWRGEGNFSNRIYYACMYKNEQITEARTSEQFRIDPIYANPELAIYQGTLYMAWRGEGSGSNRIYIASAPDVYRALLPDFGDQKEAGARNSSGKYYSFEIDNHSSPALAVFDKKLFMAWRGAGENKDRIYYSSFDGEKWSDQKMAEGPADLRIRIYPGYEISAPNLYRWYSSTSSPKLATIRKQPSDMEVLFMAWTRSEDSCIGYAEFDGTEWCSKFQGLSPLPRLLVDGGIYINNPTVDVYRTAKQIEKVATRFIIVSLGTGELRKSHADMARAGSAGRDYEKVTDLPSSATKGGWILTGGDLLDCMMRGTSTITHQQMQALQMLEFNRPLIYERFDICLSEDIKLDGVDPKNLDALRKAGEYLVELNERRLDWLVELLLNKKEFP